MLEKIEKCIDFDCATAYEDGYQIMATYCSYSQSDIARYWYRDIGFVNTPASEKAPNWYAIEAKYTYCGGYSSSTINNWGGASACGEANVFWSKVPIKIEPEPQAIRSISAIASTESFNVMDDNSSF